MPPTTTNRRKAASANEGKAKKRKANDDTSSATPQKPIIGPGYALQAHALRWGPGTDVVPSLLEAVATVQASNGSASACVVTAVGSLSQVTLRMANASRTDGGSNEIRTWEERLEIVSLVGTFASDGTKHLHMAVSRQDGTVVGGHLMEATVFTTFELVLGTMPGLNFTRELDALTGYRELVIRDESTATASKAPPPEESASEEERETDTKPPADIASPDTNSSSDDDLQECENFAFIGSRITF